MSDILWKFPNFVQFGTQSNTVLPVLQGGSGAATLTGYLKGNGTGPFTASSTIPFTDLTGVPPSAGTGNVIGPGSSTANFPALFDGATGLLLKQGTGPLGTAAYAATTAFDAAGVAAAAIATHVGLADPHTQYALESALGTASAQNTSAFDAAGVAVSTVATHAALTSGVHGITAFGLTLTSAANAAGGRSALALGAVALLATIPIEIGIAASDETTALTTGTAKATFRVPAAFTLTAVRASLTTAQASGSIFTVDINLGGTSVLSTKLTIDNTEKTSTTAAAPPVISNSTITDDGEITIDIDQVGTSGATGLKVWLIGTR